MTFPINLLKFVKNGVPALENVHLLLVCEVYSLE